MGERGGRKDMRKFLEGWEKREEGRIGENIWNEGMMGEKGGRKDRRKYLEGRKDGRKRRKEGWEKIFG